MTKRLATTAFLLGLTVAALPLTAAGAAECGLAGLLSPCVATPPSPQPAPLLAPSPAAPPDPVVTAAPTPAPATGGSASAEPAAADRLLQLVNEARTGAGLSSLAVHAGAASIAAGHSAAMAARGDIFHNSAYFTAGTRSSLGARALGENVAMNGSVEAAHQRLLASPGHRANILNGAFDAVGMAVVRDPAGTLFITQDFLDSAGAASSPPVRQPVARPAPAPAAARPAPVPVFRVASAHAPAGDAGTGAAPGAVLSAGPAAVPVPLAAAGPTPGPSSQGLLPPVSAAALALLVSVVAAWVRLRVRT